MSASDIELVEYSDRSYAVYGNTKAYKEQLKALGGKYNGALTINDAKTAGWIFPKNKLDQLMTFMEEAQPDEPQGNGLLSSGGKLTSTGKQLLNATGSGAETLTNIKKESPVRTPVKKAVKSYREIVVDAKNFKDIKKKLKHQVIVDDPEHYGAMVPGDKIRFSNGDDMTITRTVTSVMKAILANIVDDLEDPIYMDGHEDAPYVVLIQF